MLITEFWEKYLICLDHFLFLRMFLVILKTFFLVARGLFDAILSLTWGRQQEALASTWTQTKRSTCVLKREGAISTLNGGGPLKLVNKFTYLGSSVSFTESEVNMHLVKAWTAIDG